jgi:hypothetical protein
MAFSPLSEASLKESFSSDRLQTIVPKNAVTVLPLPLNANFHR